MGRTLSVALVALLLAGCAGNGSRRQGPAAEPLRTVEDDPETGLRVHLDLVERLLERGSYLAALASLDALDERSAENPAARLLRAECLRRIGRTDDAGALYRALRRTRLAAPAHRGLGLMAAQRGDLSESIEELRTARRLLPTAASIRNDLGYVLLLAGHDEDARFELMTAVELGEPGTRAERNLLLLLLLDGDQHGAEALGRKAALDRATVDAIRAEAGWLRGLRVFRAEPARTDRAARMGGSSR